MQRPRSPPLDPGVELTAYRIVQEALTNARRHAPGAAVDVELAYTADDAARDASATTAPAHRPARTDGGHGLLGMRERAATVGGSCAPARRRRRLPRRGGACRPGPRRDRAVRVVVVDDQEVVRAGFAALLGTQPDFDGRRHRRRRRRGGARCAGEQRPDVVLMDVRMPVMDGIEATRRITAAGRPRRGS